MSLSGVRLIVIPFRKMLTPSDISPSLQLRPLIRSNGELELSLVQVPVAVPAENEVVVRIEATPINPSDIGLLFGAADMGTAAYAENADGPVVTARVPERGMKSMQGRLD
jgi:NADPH2:quinone reductase